jgi:hypothetical protein
VERRLDALAEQTKSPANAGLFVCFFVFFCSSATTLFKSPFASDRTGWHSNILVVHDLFGKPASILRSGRGQAFSGSCTSADDFSPNRHPALSLLVEHDLFGKPVSTFPDHALVVPEDRQENDDRQRNAEQPQQ